MNFEAVGIEELGEYIELYGNSARKAATLAINDSVRKGRVMIKEDMRRQVALRSGYIDQRLKAKKFASNINGVGIISGTGRVTSLNRFLLNPAQMLRRKPGTPARVQVKPNSVSAIDRAFTMRLRNGNLGLAKRVDGNPDQLSGSSGARKIGKGLFLLYGPSVLQVMTTTLDRQDYIQKGIGANLQSEFTRQLRRLTDG